MPFKKSQTFVKKVKTGGKNKFLKYKIQFYALFFQNLLKKTLLKKFWEHCIGRANSHYNIPESKWANPYRVQDYGRSTALKFYEDYIRNNSSLLADLPELKNKELG